MREIETPIARPKRRLRGSVGAQHQIASARDAAVQIREVVHTQAVLPLPFRQLSL